MKITIINRLLAVILVTLLMFAVAGIALAQDPAPQNVVWYSDITLYTGNGVSTAVTGTASRTQVAFGIQDCYQIVDVTDLQTVTGKLQHSPDNSNWVDLYSFTAASADGVAFTRTTIYGGYERYWASLGTTNPVTISLKCVVKDN